MLGCLEGDNGFCRNIQYVYGDCTCTRVCLVGDVLGILIPW